MTCVAIIPSGCLPRWAGTLFDIAPIPMRCSGL
jgi:hypothetical protein